MNTCTPIGLQIEQFLFLEIIEFNEHDGNIGNSSNSSEMIQNLFESTSNAIRIATSIKTGVVVAISSCVSIETLLIIYI